MLSDFIDANTYNYIDKNFPTLGKKDENK